jgi:hypothetical protein
VLYVAELALRLRNCDWSMDVFSRVRRSTWLGEVYLLGS